jgi:hypothetical protein
MPPMRRRFAPGNAAFDHCCSHRIKVLRGSNVKQRTRRLRAFL